MKLHSIHGRLAGFAFKISRLLSRLLPSRRIMAFGSDTDMISLILVINLDRKPKRWRLTCKELSRFRTFDGKPLLSISKRVSAIDARDGRSVAATADVDSTYTVGDQLYVQPDERLREHFQTNELITMTQQEIAVARSHIETWKTVATGPDKYVLILEDDIWFRRDAYKSISMGWAAALQRSRLNNDFKEGPQLLYLSYEDAGGTAERTRCCSNIFEPKRGLWFLSGYVLSREGATALLHAMPVIGPADLWMNYNFHKLKALALNSPAILQRPDTESDNSYSMLPYLTRAGIIDISHPKMAPRNISHKIFVIAWTRREEREQLAMALAMLGLRVIVFDFDDKPVSKSEIQKLLKEFDALLDISITSDTLNYIAKKTEINFFIEEGCETLFEIDKAQINSKRIKILECKNPQTTSWKDICHHLQIDVPDEDFPKGASRTLRLFRDKRRKDLKKQSHLKANKNKFYPLDNSPWVLHKTSNWQPFISSNTRIRKERDILTSHDLTTIPSSFYCLSETFPGNLASFSKENIKSDKNGTHLLINENSSQSRPYRSGAFASIENFEYGRFEIDLKAVKGPGLVTGFFLYRDSPRQEIDIEITGENPSQMLINVFFNPGDEGSKINFGYRGTPYRIDLGFDASVAFHTYTIDWQPDRITWAVDDLIVHERVSWDPTPIPYLPMRLYANLWASRSVEFAGKIESDSLPAIATFKNLIIYQNSSSQI